MDNPGENADSLNGEQVIEGETVEQKAERLEGLNKQLFERAKKAEGFEKVEGQWVKKAPQPQPEIRQEVPKQEVSLSPKDSVMLAKSVDAEDIDEVLEFATYKKLSVTDALNSPTLKTILKERQEERQTAQATRINAPSRTSPRDNAESLLQAASQGQVPTEDSSIEALAAARLESKRKK